MKEKHDRCDCHVSERLKGHLHWRIFCQNTSVKSIVFLGSVLRLFIASKPKKPRQVQSLSLTFFRQQYVNENTPLSCSFKREARTKRRCPFNTVDLLVLLSFFLMGNLFPKWKTRFEVFTNAWKDKYSKFASNNSIWDSAK